MHDLASRLFSRPQISSDGLAAYKDAVDPDFGSKVDNGSVIKTFSHFTLEEGTELFVRRSGIRQKEVRQGDPVKDLVSTSYVEKQSNPVRMHCRRLSRLKKAHSKKRENFNAAIALHHACYNFYKRHGLLRCTPGQ